MLLWPPKELHFSMIFVHRLNSSGPPTPRAVCVARYAAVCDWELKADIGLEVRPAEDGSGVPQYWAFVDVDHFSVYALVQVVPLIAPPPGGLRYMAINEDASPGRVHPEAALAIVDDNGWPEAWPDLRVRGLNLTLIENYVFGADVLALSNPLDGFAATWHAEEGTLEVHAVLGVDWTEDVAEDYEDDQLNDVDISEVLERGDPAAAITAVGAVLRSVTFATSESGAGKRVLQLRAVELLTTSTVGNIVWIDVLNSLDPPRIIPSDSTAKFTEKAARAPLDQFVQVTCCACHFLCLFKCASTHFLLGVIVGWVV
jgi:hypothetical protein